MQPWWFAIASVTVRATPQTRGDHCPPWAKGGCSLSRPNAQAKGLCEGGGRPGQAQRPPSGQVPASHLPDNTAMGTTKECECEREDECASVSLWVWMRMASERRRDLLPVCSKCKKWMAGAALQGCTLECQGQRFPWYSLQWTLSCFHILVHCFCIPTVQPSWRQRKLILRAILDARWEKMSFL